MFSLRPASNRNFESAAPRRPEPPVYAYDPEAYRGSQSFVGDLRQMGGREARRLTFGAAFGATSGFLLARLAVGLLKVGLLVGGIMLLLALVKLGGSTAPQEATSAASPAAAGPPPVRTHAVAHTAQYATYTNPRFGFRMHYPRSFAPQGDPDNGDGRTFVSPDGLTQITASGSNLGGRTLQEEYADALHDAPGVILSQALGANGFQIAWRNQSTGVDGVLIKFIGAESENTLAVTIPSNQEEQYGDTFAHIGKSFRPGDLDSSW